MRCKKCGQKASFEIHRHRAAFCSNHLLEHLQNQVVKTINKFKMFSTKENLLLAVSGGKDSLALWDILLELGYNVDGLYIDLGIEEYSKKSKEKCEHFTAAVSKANLLTISLDNIYEIGIGFIAQKSPKAFCSVCGLIKRYIMNLTAAEGRYDAIITGHNLDDETAVLLGNTLRWQTGYLARQYPYMPSTDGLARKVKPLCRLTERETAAYCFLRKIDYILEECPMSKGASSFMYKDVLNNLESQAPGTKDQFYMGFLRTAQNYFASKADEEIELQECSNCGQPTTVKLCSFCNQMKKAGLDPLGVHKEIKRVV